MKSWRFVIRPQEAPVRQAPVKRSQISSGQRWRQRRRCGGGELHPQLRRGALAPQAAIAAQRGPQCVALRWHSRLAAGTA
eukprot:2784271-Pleurochrysis_carterae.AAC.3